MISPVKRRAKTLTVALRIDGVLTPLLSGPTLAGGHVTAVGDPGGTTGPMTKGGLSEAGR